MKEHVIEDMKETVSKCTTLTSDLEAAQVKDNPAEDFFTNLFDTAENLSEEVNELVTMANSFMPPPTKAAPVKPAASKAAAMTAASPA